MDQNLKWHTDIRTYLISINDTLYQNLNKDESIDYTDDWFYSGPTVLLMILYCLVIFGGVFGNASLLINLCTQSATRLRNPLLLGLCIADLLVTGVSAPLTIIALAMVHQSWTMPSITCKIIYFLQAMPVAASTISFLMLSLDRYATVKHPRLAQLRERRFLPIILTFGSWFSATVFCTPLLVAYKITSSSSSSSSTYEISKNKTVCNRDFGSNDIHMWYTLIHTIFVFIVPALGVILNHLGVRQKLCALSLTARAAHGELPLPMPILRRPTHMIIVTGMANGGRDVGDSSDDENDLSEKNCMMETKMKFNRKTPRSLNRGQHPKQSIKNKNRPPPSELPLPQTSTLRSRRRLANMLIVAAIIFICCWLPHVICYLCLELSAGNVCRCPASISEYGLLLGYAHSAITPIFYWILNHNSLRQSSCIPFLRISAIQRFMRTHLRVRVPPPPPSSTNEAALGAFNPRYIKAKPQQYRPPASSFNLY